MKIFTRHMAERFFRTFAFGLGLFSILIFLGHMFDKMNSLVGSPAPLGIIFEYLWLEVPYWSIRVLPMATLLATLLSLTSFVQSGEWIAAQSAGLRIRDFWKPLLWSAAAVTVVAFAAQELILPVCYRKAQRLWIDRVHPQWVNLSNVSLIGGPGTFIQAGLFLPKKGLLDRPILEKIGAKGLEYQIDAQKAVWNADLGRWVFRDGVERFFGQAQIRQKSFETLVSDLGASPAELTPRSREPDEMSLRELLASLRGTLPTGMSRRAVAVACAAKIAYPFTNLVICALGIPVALRLRRLPKILGFCLALGLSFLYLWTSEIFRALGLGGELSPWFSAWASNALFGTAAALMLRRWADG
jgi:lipopolysaccharide export system permease protein